MWEVLERAKDFGREIWQAQMTLQALEGSKQDADNPETLLLAAHVSVLLKAQESRQGK